ncbi:MAG: IS1 family transposase [Alphaproteobacteria bacterium]|nr:IS1 family transposase [Alphaproteobacteria bacterium]
MAFSKKKSCKIWIWKAFDPHTGRRLDWEFGDRDRATFDRLLNHLKHWKIRIYCADGYHLYDSALPAKQHYISKDQT